MCIHFSILVLLCMVLSMYVDNFFFINMSINIFSLICNLCGQLLPSSSFISNHCALLITWICSTTKLAKIDVQQKQCHRRWYPLVEASLFIMTILYKQFVCKMFLCKEEFFQVLHVHYFLRFRLCPSALQGDRSHEIHNTCFPLS